MHVSKNKKLSICKLCPCLLPLKTLGPNKILGLEKVLSKNILVHKNHDPKKLGKKSLVKIGPETGEILLIWTNVTRTNVVWTMSQLYCIVKSK